MTQVRQTIVNNIKSICKVKKIRNVDIAEYMGVSAGSVSNWFNGTNFLDVDNLYKLCQFLDVSLDQIFGLKPIVYRTLSEVEERLLSAYRASSPDVKESALLILESSAEKREEKIKDSEQAM